MPFSLAISGSSYGYKNTSGTFVAFRSDSTATYTYAADSTGGTVDLGARNNYRYVNASNVYNKGKADGVTVHSATYTPTSRSNALDMGSSHTYRYVNTNSVPNTNSGTYTFASGSTGAQVDLGATNTYRYVNATNVYTKGKADGSAQVATFSLTGNTNGCSFKLSTYGLSTLHLIAVREIPSGYSEGYYCKNMKADSVLYNVVAGGGGSKSITVSGDTVTVAFTNTVGQSRTFNIAIA